MKVQIRIDGLLEVVDDVGVDDTCVPLVSGARPYDSASKDSSPLVRESALWFKTLAVEAVYIDCNRRLICWTPVCRADIQDDPVSPAHPDVASTKDFIPARARPLFKDSSVYDFDASVKEMMLKCSAATLNLSRKILSLDEYHKIIARILHIYILPSIHFTRNDVASLLQVKCHIEECLAKVEDAIRAKAIAKENVKKCLDQMLNKFLCEESLDSERYLRTCDRNFLIAVLKMVECNVAALNTDLSAVQNMVNWVKEHPGDGHTLADLKARRDLIFADVDRCIQVREAIKNVAFRRDLSKRRNKKSKVTTSCVHNMFTEVVKQLELQDSNMCQLGDGKVSICAAREAVLYTLSNITDSDQHSASSLRFEPEKFTSFFLDEGQMDKSNCWLPLEGRVAQSLADKQSVASICHGYGCQKLRSQAVHILKHFQPAEVQPESIQPAEVQPESTQPAEVQPESIQPAEVQPESIQSAGVQTQSIQPAGVQTQSIQPVQAQTQFNSPAMVEVQPGDQGEDMSYEEDLSCQFSLSLSDVTMRPPRLVTQAGYKRNAVFICEDSEEWRSYFQHPNLCYVESPETAGMSCASDFSPGVSDATVSLGSVLQDSGCVHVREGHGAQTWRRAARRDVVSDDYILVPGHRETSSAHLVFTEKESPIKQQELRQLTLSVFMDAVEELKGQIQAHLTDVIELLGQETLASDSADEMSLKEQQELLWKSYDRFFCQELYVQLLNLYTMGLTPGIQKAYAELQKMSVLDILNGDKLLELFFSPSILRSRASPIPMARRAGDVSAVSFSIVRRDFDDFMFSFAGVNFCSSVGTENTEANECHDRQCRYESSHSVTQSIDEGFDQVSGSFSSSVRSTFSNDSLNEDADDLCEYAFSRTKIEDNLSLALSPFMELVGVFLKAGCFNDKIRYITTAIEGLNDSISQLCGLDFKSTCDDIISMLVLALCNIPEHMFTSLYVHLRLLMDVLPSFFFGSRWDFNLVSLYSAYNYLFTLKISDHIIKMS